MASLIDENTQFVDSAGSPIVNGYIYVGTQNLDPVTNTITIYSDRELTVSISNPQRTDAYGRAVTRIFVPAKYSLKVEDENNVQQYLELDNGEIEQTGISLLTNVLGTDTITAEGAPAVTSLVDNQQYNFRAANTNTGTVTLQIDLTAAKSIKKYHDVNLAAGDIEQNQTVVVVYNAVDDVFELVANVANTFIQHSTVETNHVRAGAMQLWDGDVSGDSATIHSNITIDTWESYGPTGSGADNIFTMMDKLPSNAVGIIVAIELRNASTAAANIESKLFVAGGDAATPVATGTARPVAYQYYTTTATGQSARVSSQAILPLNGSQVGQAFWTESVTSGSANTEIYFYYMGFVTD